MAHWDHYCNNLPHLYTIMHFHFLINSISIFKSYTAGIEIAGRSINHLRYADDTILMAESELKSLLMKVKEESEKGCLRAQHSEN